MLLGTTDAFGTPLFTPGSHQLGIRVGDQFANVTDIASIAVTFTCRDFTKDDLSIGRIDTPVVVLLYGGSILASGWALDFQKVAAALISLDGTIVPTLPPSHPRPDITTPYPSYPTTPLPGWFTYLDTTHFSNGIHQLSAQVIDGLGNETFR